MITIAGKDQSNGRFFVYSKYFYSKLTEPEQRLYRSILNGWMAHQSKILIDGSFSCDGGSGLERAVDAIRADNPELFYVDFSKISFVFRPAKLCVCSEFLYGREESERRIVQIRDVVNRVVFRAENAADRLRAAHDYLAENVKYDYAAINVPSSAGTADAHSIAGVFMKNEAVCEGFARAFKLLCDALKIPCIVVSGTAVSKPGNAPEHHSWNIVRHNGANYHVDTTWDAITAGTSYYLVSDNYIRRDHQWDESKWPKCSTKGFVELNTVTVTTPERLAQVLQSAIAQKKPAVYIEFNKTFSSESEIGRLIRDHLPGSAAASVEQYSYNCIGGFDNVTVRFVYRCNR